jgi:hypothetical protein
MVLADSHGISRVPRYSGTCPASQKHFAYGVVTLYDRPFQAVRLCFWLVTRRFNGRQALQPPRASTKVWAISAFARRY